VASQLVAADSTTRPSGAVRIMAIRHMAVRLQRGRCSVLLPLPRNIIPTTVLAILRDIRRPAAIIPIRLATEAAYIG
jgi:hypothetical protein